MRALLLVPALYVIIFFTGAAGLVYEVTWQKYVSRLLGSDSIATAIILGVFLGGLSLGYFLCGKLSVYVRNHLKAYAAMEGIIGAWCILFPQIFQWVEAWTESWSFAPPALVIVQGLFCATVLMGVPTVCMGSTIPFLTRGISRNITDATHVHARVYAINTAGAFMGTLLAGFYLIPEFGLPLTMMGTAFMNLAAFLCIYVIQQWLKSEPDDDVAAVAPAPDDASVSPRTSRFKPAWHFYTIAFLSGFYVMTLENALIRIFNLSLGSSSYSFTLVIAVFILCIAVGSYIVGQLRNISKKTLYTNQLLIALSLFVVFLTMDTWPYWAHLIRISVQSNPAGFWMHYVIVFQVLLLLLGAPVALMGATVPLAFHEIKRNLKNVGRHSGYLFSLNTIGSLTGSLIGGIVFYYFLNNGRIFLVAATLAGLSTLIASFGLDRRRMGISAAVTAALMVMAAAGLGYEQTRFATGVFRNRTPLKYSLAGTTEFFKSFNKNMDIKYYNDGPTATVAAVGYTESDGTKTMSIYVNGKSDSNTVAEAYTLKLSAHIPTLLAKQRQDVMVIGLGTGMTAGELSLYSDVKRIDVAEISPSVVKALPLFSDFTHAVHQSPKLHITVADAFRVLGRSKRSYDIIISEPSNPWVTGVDLLFTQEFYRMVKRRLNPKGLFLQWTHTYAANAKMVGMVISTVKSAFRYCNVFVSNPGDLLILGSDHDFTANDLQRARTVLAGNPRVAASLRAIGIDSLDAVLIRQVWSNRYTELYLSNFTQQTMDNPRLHYLAGRCFFQGLRLPSAFFINTYTAPYSEDYLLARSYPHWRRHLLSADWKQSVVRSMQTKKKYNQIQAAGLLDFRFAYQQWNAAGRTENGNGNRDLKLLALIEAYPVDETAWGAVGLRKASYQKRAETLLDHVRRLRSWITPYPIDGLRALLQEGSAQGKDDFEKNWCILQLAHIILTEDQDLNQAMQLHERLIRDASGRIRIEGRHRHMVIKLQEQFRTHG